MFWPNRDVMLQSYAKTVTSQGFNTWPVYIHPQGANTCLHGKLLLLDDILDCAMTK